MSGTSSGEAEQAGETTKENRKNTEHNVRGNTGQRHRERVRSSTRRCDRRQTRNGVGRNARGGASGDSRLLRRKSATRLISDGGETPGDGISHQADTTRPAPDAGARERAAANLQAALEHSTAGNLTRVRRHLDVAISLLFKRLDSERWRSLAAAKVRHERGEREAARATMRATLALCDREVSADE